MKLETENGKREADTPVRVGPCRSVPPHLAQDAGRGTACRHSGFSLIEVNMALLVVSLGLAALLGLFPVGLRESNLASADTTQALVATRILNAIQAKAATLTTWAQWSNRDSFVAGIDIEGAAVKADGTKQTVENVAGIMGNTVCYQLTLDYVAGTESPLRYAAIRVADNKYSNITNNPVYYTEFRYGCN